VEVRQGVGSSMGSQFDTFELLPFSIARRFQLVGQERGERARSGCLKCLEAEKDRADCSTANSPVHLLPGCLECLMDAPTTCLYEPGAEAAVHPNRASVSPATVCKLVTIVVVRITARSSIAGLGMCTVLQLV